MEQHYLSIAIAARKLGIKRAVLQQKIRDGAIHSMNGTVDINELKAEFSSAEELDSTPMIEKMQFIKDNAYANRITTAHLPAPDVMYSQIKKLRLKLKFHRKTEHYYQRMLTEACQCLNNHPAHTEEETMLVKRLLSILRPPHISS
jgi:CDP-4-dehydro-6-deoxyglucose reductase, E3